MLRDAPSPSSGDLAVAEGQKRDGALAGLRALDLTDECGFLCGKMLADLGVEVVLVEPPDGAALRDEPHYWASYARNKHSLVADLATPAGRASVRELACNADFLLESRAPGELAALGLGYDDVAALNPAIVYVSITPFGQTGPKARWRATDLIAAGRGGRAPAHRRRRSPAGAHHGRRRRGSTRAPRPRSAR